MRVQTLLCRLGLVVASVVAFVGLPSAGAAQTSTGSIRGYVTDSVGNALEGARVVAVSVLSGAQREVTTQSKGYYALLGLVPGEYDLTARQIGMAPQKIRARVLVGGVYPVDFKLAANAIQLEAVTIAVASGLETHTSEVATNVTQKQIEALPTASRNFLDLAALAPGVTVSPDFVNLGGNSVTPRAFSAGAQGPGEVNVFVDGTSLKNDLTGNGASGVAGQDASRGNPFPRNAIQEYRVITQNFKAEYQNASSAIISATTKSGGSVWSGDAFVNYENKDWVALDSISLAQKVTKPDYHRYIVGLSGGGPLVKDRLQAFVSYEGNYQNRANVVAISPPATGAFPALDTVSFTKYNGAFESPFRETLLFGKLSYTAGTHSSVELSVNYRHETDVRDFGGNGAFDNATNYLNNGAFGVLKHSYFNGSWLNELQLQYSRFRRNPTPNTPDIPNRWYAFPTACCITLGSNLSSQDFTQKGFGVRDDITYTGFHSGGEHVLKVGAALDFVKYDEFKANNLTPQFFFADSVNCNPSCTGNQGYAYRSPYIMQWATGDPTINANNTQVGAYAQDDWSPSPRLTINLGIRWDFETHMFNYNYVTQADVRDTVNRYWSTLQNRFDTTAYFTNGSQRNKFYGAFQPRLGFSYALDRESKTTLFGAWGIFYDRSFFDLSVDETLKLSRPLYTVFFADPDSAAAGHVAPGQIAWNNSYLTTDTTALKALLNSGQAAGREVWLISNNVKVPKSYQFNIGLRRLFGDVLVSAAYVGVRGVDGLVFNWANFALNPNGSCCVGGGFGHGFTNILITTNSVKTWYDAVQIQVTRPYKKSGNFGWGGGLAITNGQRSIQGIDNPDDQFAFPQSRFIGKHPSNDEKSRVVGNWVMDLPFAYGIQFSGLMTLGSGPRYDVGSRFNLPNGPYVPGGFSPPQYAFIVPGAWAYRDVDLRLRKDFPGPSGNSWGVVVDVFNVFDFQNFTYFAGNPTPTGLLSDARRTQVGAEYHF